MEISSILAFLAAAVALTIMPGPDNLFVLAISIAQGKRAGIFTTLGLCTGLLVHISAAVLGISAIVYRSAFAFHLVKYAGAAYLLYLAWKAFRQKQTQLSIESQNSMPYRSLYKRGILMNVLNPKVSLFFLALLPQFVTPSRGFVSLQMLVLGIIFLIQSLLLFSLFSIFADKVRTQLLKRPFIAERLNLLEGTILGLIGLSIALSGGER